MSISMGFKSRFVDGRSLAVSIPAEAAEPEAKGQADSLTDALGLSKEDSNRKGELGLLLIVPISLSSWNCKLWQKTEDPVAALEGAMDIDNKPCVNGSCSGVAGGGGGRCWRAVWRRKACGAVLSGLGSWRARQGCGISLTPVRPLPCLGSPVEPPGCVVALPNTVPSGPCTRPLAFECIRKRRM